MSRLTFRLAEPPGSVELIALLDAEGAFFQSRQEAFPNATADDWRRADALDPQAVRAGEWWLRFRCFAVRHEDGRVLLVDLGVGPSTAPSRSWAPVPGRLPDELASAGISPQTVETVIVTHMHTDHIGWVTDGLVSTPLLPNARYLLQRTEIDTIERRNPAVKTWLLDPVRATGQLQAVDGDLLLRPGLRVVATPGHTPGHQSVVLEAESNQVLITGDLLASVVQLINPEITYLHDMDPDQARQTRIATLRELRRQIGALLATPHLGQAFVRLDTLSGVE
jgi:glyoxylase-like metal-dependent hydrolase (beta-lactamase superfamily II)